MDTLNEMPSTIESSETQQGIEQVSEADLTRVSEETRQAAQMRAQIAQASQTNQKFAQFLKHLLTELHERLLTLVIETFFTNDEGKPTQNVPIEGLVGFFAPFYQDVILSLELENYYNDLFAFHGEYSITTEVYAGYCNQLLKKFDELQQKDKTKLVEMVAQICNDSGLKDIDPMTHEEKVAFKNSLFAQIYPTS